MSAASLSATPTLTTLPERAFSLHCQGLRSPDIAQVLGVPQRTVRYWIAKVRDELVAAETAELRDEFLRAVEHFHQLSAAAWAAFEAEQQQAYPTPSDAADTPDISDDAISPVGASGWTPSSGAHATVPSPAPKHSPTPRHSPRYLRLALDAQRQISRLLGHYDHPDRFLAPALHNGPSSDHAADQETEIPAKTAMPHVARPEIPAKTATTNLPPLSPQGAGSARNVACSEEKGGQGPGVRTPFSAKTATPPVAPSASPAKTATTLTTGLAAGIQPANPRPPIPPAILASPGPTAPLAAHGAGSARSRYPGDTERSEQAKGGQGVGGEVPFPAKTATSLSSSVPLRSLRSLRVEPRPRLPAFPDSVPLHWRM